METESVVHVILVSLNEPILQAEEGSLCLADILASNDNLEERIIQRDFISRLPRQIVHIGEKRAAGFALTAVERKRLQRFRDEHRSDW